MTRHTTFKFCLDPTAEQEAALARHAGAARFAYNQCLRLVKCALDKRNVDASVDVPWTAFDLINLFNRWKKTEGAGRVFAVDSRGVVDTIVTGLAWRSDVCQQVFEEAAVDLGRALSAWSNSRGGQRRGRRIGFPRFKKKSAAAPTFRLRNNHRKGMPSLIRLGDENRVRSVRLPGIGQLRVHDDTRPLRRMLAKHRARILFATVSRRGGRWWVSLNVVAAEFHSARQHQPRVEPNRHGGWVGIDRGLSVFLVAATADGKEVDRIDAPPKALATGMSKQRRLAKSLSRKKKGSRNRRTTSARLARHHLHVANVRRHFLHQVSNSLVKTHDRLVVEDLNVSGMLANRRLAKAISDAGWAAFARMLTYKQAWRGGELVVADRWFPSSKLCPQCGVIDCGLTLADRVFACGCGYLADRDTNAAVNLARWSEDRISPDPRTSKQRGRATNARRRDGTDLHLARAGETSLNDAGTEVDTALAGLNRRTPEKGGGDDRSA
ncbi:putative transposase [Mycolicibacterium sp. BK556]|uniref:RNA-guided endonuclease InsQ/TnpB family protein n=1 Tax=unclassified Mycolicibacterium TaxID=2636767 RepID=UPI001622B989|nr:MULTISPECIES: RNA-guided endonuclease TnpB family protein [unclassified Mycolicibacterium]MBB3604667.1 putative transposase [Mycolicibacterium sp. BK556]MBB3634620.1 putative transposase [Mycolicibacterium sp. BK607]MBB3752196.1 putative transposase [Mycolicibacterium sp. BK634]